MNELTIIYATPEEFCFELDDHTYLIKGEDIKSVQITAPCEEVETIYPE